MPFNIELLIEFRDNERPLGKTDVEALIEETRARGIPMGVSVSLRERRPGLGELASLAHIWQIAVDLTTSQGALAVGGTAGLATALRPVFKIFEKREEQVVVLKGPGFELKGPASMFSGQTDELIERVKEAIASQGAGRRRADQSTVRATRTPASKRTATKKSATTKAGTRAAAGPKSGLPARGRKRP